MAVASQPYGQLNRCNGCGFCSGFGCLIVAWGSVVVSFLHPAMLHGVEVIPRAFVSRIETDARGKQTTKISYLDNLHHKHRIDADTIIVADSAIETARLLL